MRIFVTVPFNGGRENIEKFCSLIKSAGFEDFCFVRDVEHYAVTFEDPKELMERVTEEIEKSEALLIDMTEKSRGRAVEAGIAYNLGKKIIVIMKRGTIINDATKGLADMIIEYDKLEDIVPALAENNF